MPTPTEKRWNELADEFHMMLGHCIAVWAEVDDELFRIFRHCVGPYEQCSIIYYKTPGLNMRLGLTDELVRSILPKKTRKSGGHDHPDVKAWDKTKLGFGELLAVRRRIAHLPVEMRQVAPPFNNTMFAGAGMLAEPWFEINFSKHERMRNGTKETKPLKLADLTRHLVTTTVLRDQLSLFFQTVLAKHASPSPPQAPEPDPAR